MITEAELQRMEETARCETYACNEHCIEALEHLPKLLAEVRRLQAIEAAAVALKAAEENALNLEVCWEAKDKLFALLGGGAK